MRILVVLTSLVITCIALFAQSSDTAEADVLAVMQERRAASMRGDSKAVSALMADDYAQTDIYGHVQDKATWLKDYFEPLAVLIRNGTFHWETYEARDVQVRVNGDSAVVTGLLVLKGTGARITPDHKWQPDPQSTISASIRFTHIHVRRNGKWLLFGLHNAIPIQPGAQQTK